MIQRVSHGTIWVEDQERAKGFYVDKLGFEVRADVTMGNFRWLTVGPKAQPDFELVLMRIGSGMRTDAETTARVRELVTSGMLGGYVLATDDCQKTYEDLVAKGVEFPSPPTEHPYGIQAMFKDDSGNLFSLSQQNK